MVICFNCWAWDLGVGVCSRVLLTVFTVWCDCLQSRVSDNMPFTSQFFALSRFLTYIPVSSLICLCLLHSPQIPSIPHQTPFPITAVFFLSHLFLIPMSSCCFITINLPASWSGRKTSVQRSLLVTAINLPPKSTASFLPQSRNNFSLQLKHGFMASCQCFYSHMPLFNS